MSHIGLADLASTVCECVLGATCKQLLKSFPRLKLFIPLFVEQSEALLLIDGGEPISRGYCSRGTTLTKIFPVPLRNDRHTNFKRASTEGYVHVID